MYPQPNGQEHAGHKRKRSDLEDSLPYSEQRPHEYSPSIRPEPQHMANRALHVLGSGSHNGTPYYQNGTEQHHGHTWHSEGPVQSHPPANVVRPSTSEAQMAEVLQRESSVSEAPSRSWESQPTTNGQAASDQYGHEAITPPTTVALKRKRNFSNRTKTGCLTCRTRKKKCDEARPRCDNCLRGGFECKGYISTKGVDPTQPTPVRTPVPLQSKDDQGDVSESSPYTGPHMDALHASRPPVHHDGVQARPAPMSENDGSRPASYGSSPPRNGPPNRLQYPGQPQRPQQHTQSSYSSDHLPALSDANRSEQPLSARPQAMSRPPPQGTPYPQPPPPSHQGQTSVPIQYPPQHTASPTQGPSHPPPAPPPLQQPSQWNQRGYTPTHPPSAGPSTTPIHTRMSSSGFDHPRSSFKVSSQEDVEKSKMLRSVHYNYFDATLLYERQRCDRAVERYNAACKLDSGLGEQEVRNLFVKVIDPSQDTTHRLPSHNHSKGHIGPNVKIEAPFTCTYGYNLKVQEDVYIGKGCYFDDSGTIEIGPRTIIAPFVTILTTDYGKDLVHRKGTRGPHWSAGDVFIAANVIIGARAVIYPGVRIEEGATVEPGAVVCESLTTNQIQRASRARIDDAIPL
ncbi:hypothetical protein G647_01190 [Cladophialophora carrionii CBS 160.54]|uniref:Zn(2)-C6 fungal-type domain-containing protein n=1 Tax=Cladophialophora carrionii CBS 160.54 TaxID=1279043 RepID=V9DPB4_9EURO|nr:uncharacterized protein G647_01190 [Cladophialophora carrionii CBS 160.54]ETI28739.1 hypothetical protein G647_01190 [Cladophialophora carrionii CBS 160.54]